MSNIQLTSNTCRYPYENVSIDSDNSYIGTYNTKLSIADDCNICFEDGFAVTGKELQMYLKVLQKIVEQDFPEELF